MNYLVVVNSLFADNPSGSARVAWDIACLARDHGHKTTILCSSHKLAPQQSTKSEEAGIRVVRYSRASNKFSLLRRKQYTGAIAGALKEHLNGFNADSIHLHSFLPACGLISTLGENQPYIATVHSPVVPETEMNWRGDGGLGKLKIALGGLERLRKLQQNVYDHCRRAHVLSEFTRSELQRFHDPLPQCSVIPHWRRPELRRRESKAEARAALNWPQSQSVLFSLRRMVPRMGHASAIRAIAPLLPKYDARMVLAGTGVLLESLRALAAQTEGGDRIAFPGRISDNQMRLMYSGADLFVLPTLALECFGLIILEALSFGCPVLATRTGSIPEILEPILPNYLVPQSDEDALRDKAEAFLNGTLRRPSESELLQFVERNYDQSVIAPRVMEFIRAA
jgi:glycosyltransferase involved in cell wall biosynthesis